MGTSCFTAFFFVACNKRVELEKGTSVAAKRWKKAYRRVIMINQVGRMKLHLATMEKKQRYEQQVAERLRLSKIYPTLDALRSPVRKPSELLKSSLTLTK